MANKQLRLGVLAGLLAGMLWGVVFVVPQALPNFTAVELSLGRYFFFGIASSFSLKSTWRDFRDFAPGDRWQVLWLSAAGFWLYTIILFWAVKEAGGVVATLTIGVLPVSIPLVAKRTWRLEPMFVVGLGLILAGLLVLQSPQLNAGRLPLSWRGSVAGVCCLVMWTWFAIRNTDFLRKYPHARISLTNLMGLSSLIVLVLVGGVLADLPRLLHRDQFVAYAVWSAMTGIGSSWGANVLWNTCSRNCPPTVSGPLVGSETVFGLLYTFVFFRQRPPSPTEFAVILLFISGVFLALRSESRGHQALPIATT